MSTHPSPHSDDTATLSALIDDNIPNVKELQEFTPQKELESIQCEFFIRLHSDNVDFAKYDGVNIRCLVELLRVVKIVISRFKNDCGSVIFEYLAQKKIVEARVMAFGLGCQDASFESIGGFLQRSR
jgi:hypothetical protein